jgi:hypothetical protein
LDTSALEDSIEIYFIIFRPSQLSIDFQIWKFISRFKTIGKMNYNLCTTLGQYLAQGLPALAHPVGQNSPAAKMT